MTPMRAVALAALVAAFIVGLLVMSAYTYKPNSGDVDMVRLTGR